MMAAIKSAEEKNEVILLEKMSSLGRKLLITGKGRCNITSSLPIDEFINNIPGNGRFLYSAFQNYTNKDIINFLKSYKLEVKEERGKRIFPKSDKSQDVLNVFIKRLQELNVNINLNTKVEQINTNNEKNKVLGVTIQNGKVINADKIIIATGGNSYPATGSTGEGYKIVEKLGHTITKIKPSLVPLCANNGIDIESENIKKSIYKNSLVLCKSMQGLSLKNVEVKIQDTKNNKIIYQDFGEMIFTHFGISGPTILSGSAHLLRYKNIEGLMKNGNIILKIDLKPALSEQKLDTRILRDFEMFKNKELKNSLDELLPKKLIEPIIELSEIDKNKKVNSITKEERKKLVDIIKQFSITISGFRPIEEAIITAGGVSIKEINPKTMESKLISGLYFAGEIIDVDAYTGGFNLQIAYSTGYTAGSEKL